MFCRRTLISAFLSPLLLPSSWWSTTCGVRRRRVRRRETATVRFSSSNRRFACGGNRSDATACRPAQPPSTVRQHYQLLNGKVATCIYTVHDVWVCIDLSLFFILFYIDWDTISWLFKNTWMCFLLLDINLFHQSNFHKYTFVFNKHYIIRATSSKISQRSHNIYLWFYNAGL